MHIQAVAHINFNGNARKAIEFYQAVFGGEKMLVTYRAGGRSQDAVDPDHIMWGQVTTGDGMRLMAYDVQAGLPWNPGENAFYISLTASSANDIILRWEALSRGATIVVPLAPSTWGPLYGKLKDAFGVVWVLSVDQASVSS